MIRPFRAAAGRWLALALVLLAFAAHLDRGADRLRASVLLGRAEARSQALLVARRFTPAEARLHLEWLAESRRLDPSNVATWIGMGSQHLASGRAAEAEPFYRRAIELEKRAEGYLNLARSLKAQGRDREALETMRLVFRLNPALARLAVGS